jgi:hypothetical protein
MQTRNYSGILLLTVLLYAGCSGGPKVEFSQAEDRIDVLVDGRILNSYLYGGHLAKPVLYPVMSPSGEVVTRWYPLKEVEGESHDHPHHTGVSFTYGSNGEVNGNSYWGNVNVLPPLTIGDSVAHIKQVEVQEMAGGAGYGRLATVNHWIDSTGNPILEEKRLMEFVPSDNQYRIDFTIRLSAIDKAVTFEDTKEGMFAIRVADWLAENPGGSLSEGTGEYMNAEGEKTEKNIWGKPSAWVRLEGENNGKTIGVAIFHHPESVNYPAYWHARGYGCFAANPIGLYDYQTGRGVEDPQNRTWTLNPGELGLFKFRLLIYEGPRTMEQLEQEFDQFRRD